MELIQHNDHAITALFCKLAPSLTLNELETLARTISPRKSDETVAAHLARTVGKNIDGIPTTYTDSAGKYEMPEPLAALLQEKQYAQILGLEGKAVIDCTVRELIDCNLFTETTRNAIEAGVTIEAWQDEGIRIEVKEI